MSRTQDADLPKICIQGISGYAQSTLRAESLHHSLEPSSHDPGGHHTVAIGLVARLCNITEQEVETLARAAGGYIRLCWTFPGHNYHVFETRHFVVTSGKPGDVSFSGGLGWPLRLLETAQMFNFNTVPSQPPRKSSTWPLPSLPPRPAPSRSWITGPGSTASPVFPFHGPADDEPFDPLDLTSESTVSDTASFAFSDEAGEDTILDDAVLAFSDHASEATMLDAAAICLPDASHRAGHATINWEDSGKLAEQQLQIEHLSRQRTDAVAMFAENGDTSGLLAVMAAASQSSIFWDPSGMPRF